MAKRIDMALYIIKPLPPSIEGYEAFKSLGYYGTYEDYLSMIDSSDIKQIFVNGDLGEHCTECLEPASKLCDYPVGDGKTCDRNLCDRHAFHVANDTDYCRDHFIMWNEYLASERGYDVLHNITPLPPKE